MLAGNEILDIPIDSSETSAPRLDPHARNFQHTSAQNTWVVGTIQNIVPTPDILAQESSSGRRYQTENDVSEVKSEQHLTQYLRGLRENCEISASVADFAWKSWIRLSSLVLETTKKRLPVPDAAPGANGELLYTWDKNEHHFELEILPDGKTELFYANRLTGNLWDADYSVCEEFSQEAIAKISTVI